MPKASIVRISVNITYWCWNHDPGVNLLMLMRKVLRIYKVWRKTSSSAWTTRLSALNFLFYIFFYIFFAMEFCDHLAFAQGLLEFEIFVFNQQFSAASPMALGFCVIFSWLFSDASSGITWHSVAIETCYMDSLDEVEALNVSVSRRSWRTCYDMLLRHLAIMCWT